MGKERSSPYSDSFQYFVVCFLLYIHYLLLTCLSFSPPDEIKAEIEKQRWSLGALLAEAQCDGNWRGLRELLLCVFPPVLVLGGGWGDTSQHSAGHTAGLCICLY